MQFSKGFFSAVSTAIAVLAFVGLVQEVVAQEESDLFSVQELVKRLEATELRLQQTEKRLAHTEGELKVIRSEDQTQPLQDSNLIQQTEIDTTAVQTQSLETKDYEVIGADYDKSSKNCGICSSDGSTGRLFERVSWNQPGGWRLQPFGKFELETIFANDATVSENYVVFAKPRASIGTEQIDVTGQSTQFGLNVQGPRMGNFQVGGLMLMDFHGNRPSRNEPGAYFIRGYAELFNDDWRVAFGQMGDTIGGWNAEVVNWQGLGGLGFLGANQRGTFRVDRYCHPSENSQWTFTGALSQPVVTDLAGLSDVVGQDNGLPNFEGQIVWGVGPDCGKERPLQMSLSGMYGEYFSAAGPSQPFPAGIQVTSQAYAVSGAMQWTGELMGVRGQIWHGRGLGTYMGGISQSLNLSSGETIQASGGYGQVWVRVLPRVKISMFAGIDDPRDSDLSTIPGDNQRQLNQVVGANVIWNISDYMHFGFDVMGVETDFVDPGTDNDVVAVLSEMTITY